MRSTNLKRLIIFATLGLLLFAAAYVMYSYSFIEIIVENPTGTSEVSYKITDSNNSVVSVLSSDTTTKRLVKRGTHQVHIQQADQSYFSLTNAGGFFSSTTLNAKLEREKSRQFVGDNPGSCVYFLNLTLLSHPCGGRLNKLDIHMPANASQPTHTKKQGGVVEGYVEGLVTIKDGTYVVVKAPEAGEDQGSPHTAYLIDSTGRISLGTSLKGLNPNNVYQALSYNNGALLYNLAESQLFYYSSFGAEPTPVSIDKPLNDSLKPFGLSTLGETIVVSYSEGSVIENNRFGTSEEREASGVAEVIIYQNNTSKHFSLSKLPLNIRLCGDEQLCVLQQNGNLEVFATDGDKLKKLSMITDVTKIENVQNGLLIVRTAGVFFFDPIKNEGYLSYALSDYEYCGIKTAASGYILCVTNSKNVSSTLYVNLAQPGTDAIDKKVAELAKLKDIKSVSAYGAFIFISPELGDLVYNSTTKGFQYDPIIRSTVANKINQEVDRLQIDRNVYRVINTLN